MTSRRSMRLSFVWLALSSLVVLTLVGPVVKSNVEAYQKVMLLLIILYFMLAQAGEAFDVRTKYYKEMIDRATRRMGK